MGPTPYHKTMENFKGKAKISSPFLWLVQVSFHLWARKQQELQTQLHRHEQHTYTPICTSACFIYLGQEVCPLQAALLHRLRYTRAQQAIISRTILSPKGGNTVPPSPLAPLRRTESGMWRNVLSNWLPPILGSEIHKEDTWPTWLRASLQCPGMGSSSLGNKFQFHREH